MRIGFVGLGLMGRPMALNLLKGGHEVIVWARRSASMDPLLDAGAIAGKSPAELAARADIVISMVADGPDVEQVMIGGAGIDGVIEAGQPGLVAIDMSTIQPSTARSIAGKLAARGIDFLDAPVSGGDVGAHAGTLSIMVGGKAAAFEKAQAVFACLGKNVVHVGESGAGQVTKAANNLVIAQTVLAIAEAFCLARKSGVDPGKMREALMGGFAASRVLDVHGVRMLERNFKPGFKAWMHQKDLNIALRSAQELNLAMPGTAMVSQIYNAAVAQGFGDDDSTSIVRVIEHLSAIGFQ